MDNVDIKIIVDKQSELRMKDAADRLRNCCKNNAIKVYNKDITVVFSNDHNFVKDTVARLPKNVVVVNVTENLSEQHIINALKYVSDICYLKTDVNIIATRIINAYNRNMNKVRNRIWPKALRK